MRSPWAAVATVLQETMGMMVIRATTDRTETAREDSARQEVTLVSVEMVVQAAPGAEVLMAMAVAVVLVAGVARRWAVAWPAEPVVLVVQGILLMAAASAASVIPGDGVSLESPVTAQEILRSTLPYSLHPTV